MKKRTIVGIIAGCMLCFNVNCAYAEEEFNTRAVPFDSDEVAINLEVGETALAASDFDTAVTAFSRAFMLDPKSYPAVYNLGYVSQIRGKLDEAVRYYRLAMRLDPEKADAPVNIGTIFMMNGRNKEAIEMFEKALAADPVNQNARFNMAAAMLNDGKFAKAYGAYSKLLQEKDVTGVNREEISIKAALAAIELDKFAEAAEHLKITPSVLELNVEKAYLEGCLDLKMNKAKEAEALFNSALAAAKTAQNASLEKLLSEKIENYKKTKTNRTKRITE